MAAPRVLLRRDVQTTGSSPTSRTMEVLNVLQGLASLPKGQLKYDTNWKPTTEALEEFSKPPRLSKEMLSSVSPTSKSLSLSGGARIKQRIEESESDVFSINSASSSVESTLENDRIIAREADLLLEKELQASFDRTHIDIKNYTEEKHLQAQDRLRSRKEKMIENSKKLQQEKDNYLQEKENERVEEFIKSVQGLQEDEKRKSEEARQRQQQLEQSHEEYAQQAVRKVKEVEALRLKVLKEEQQIRKQLMQLEVSFSSIRETASTIQQIFQQFKYQSSLSTSMTDVLKEVDKVLKVSQNAFDDANEKGQVTEMNEKIMHECSSLIQAMLQKTKNIVEEISVKAMKEEAERQAKAKEEEEKKEKEKAEKEKAERAARERQNSQISTSASQTTSGSQQTSGLSKELTSCLSELAWHEYSRLLSYKAEITKTAEPLNTDKSLKQLKFDLQKAVATPINSISEESILDKIQRLTKFLSGASVSVGRKEISISVHPAAEAYCKEMIARKLVAQGSQQVSSSVSSAFPIAAVAIGVWSSFPDVGDLILMRFYEECPFLVPFYIPKAAGMTDAEYFATLGYLCLDGQVEQKDKYLKRMTGIVRLYAAIISSLPPPGRSQPHPHGPEKGWTWLARMLNLEPRPDYTATALYEFLSIAGNALMKQYKKQFGKLLNTLVLDYVPKIETVTAKEQSGPVSRLKIFLEKCIKDQKIPLPEGYLTPQWWRSARF